MMKFDYKTPGQRLKRKAPKKTITPKESDMNFMQAVGWTLLLGATTYVMVVAITLL